MAVAFRSAALTALLFLTACAGGLETGQSLTIVQHKPEGFATWTDYVPVFRLGVGDKMKIKFLITREMDDEITVGPDGFVGVRVAGRVRAEGQTIPDLQDAIIAGSRNVLRPQSVVVSPPENASSVGTATADMAYSNLSMSCGRNSRYSRRRLQVSWAYTARDSSAVYGSTPGNSKSMLAITCC